MNIITPHEMSRIEKLSYDDGALESDFMEEAGAGVAVAVNHFIEKNKLERVATLFCGKGNNAGDAYVAGSFLLENGYEVTAYQIVPIDECSPLCQKNYKRFIECGGIILATQESETPSRGVIIDGIFGTGFHGKAGEPYSTFIEMANQSPLPVIAVDIPSGLNGETGDDEGAVIVADETVFLGLPKEGFFLGNGWNHVGKLRYVDFGLEDTYIDQAKKEMFLITKEFVQPFKPKITPNRHKYQAGFVVGLAGSPGMPGAAAMSTLSALRGGAGMVKLLHPNGMQPELGMLAPEVVRIPFDYDQTDLIIEWMNRAGATFIGPGIGLNESSRQLLKEVLPKLTKPCVIDADALTILSEEDISLPEKCLLTPHRGELQRLMHDETLPKLDKQYIKRCQDFAEKKKITLILKGGPTFVFNPGDLVGVCTASDPGMATAGSGDVLTGLLAALLSTGIKPKEAACLGTYLHGLAGLYAARELTSHCMIATDLIEYFPLAFRTIQKM